MDADVELARNEALARAPQARRRISVFAWFTT
jgi:hypothetical protein